MPYQTKRYATAGLKLVNKGARVRATSNNNSEPRPALPAQASGNKKRHASDTTYQEPNHEARPHKKPRLDRLSGTQPSNPKALSQASQTKYSSMKTPQAPEEDPASSTSQSDPESSDDGAFPVDITYGYLKPVGGGAVPISLGLPCKGQERLFLFVGRDPKLCQIVIGGSQIGAVHCAIVLEFIDNDEGPLVRRVLLQRLNLESQRALETAIMVQGEVINLGNEPLVLPRGCLVKFGRGPWYRYYKPQYQDLYEEADQFYGKDPGANSSVHRARRIHDGQPFVTKTITATRTHANMARTELYAYMKLGPHSNIVRAMENFYDPDAQLYRIILETAITDLHTLLLRLRSEGQADLATMAPIWIDQLTSGFQHVHQCGMAHRDVKPENVLVFVPEPGRIVLKLTDFGLARLPKQPVLIGCSAGTPGWMAPASFAYHNDDRLSDCYGVGRLLYAILTSRAWPNEPTKRGRSCGCPSACPNACTEREAAFQDVENAKAGKHCVGFLRKLLVGSPDHCMNAQEMRQHQYLKPASSGFLQQVVKSVEWRLYRRLIQMCTAA